MGILSNENIVRRSPRVSRSQKCTRKGLLVQTGVCLMFLVLCALVSLRVVSVGVVFLKSPNYRMDLTRQNFSSRLLRTERQKNGRLLGSSIASQSTSITMLLARNLTPQVKHNAMLLRHYGINAHIMLDSPVPATCGSPFVHFLSDRDTIAANFTDLTFPGIGAWDRALLWFFRSKTVRFMWILEDDFAWSPPDALPKLIKVMSARVGQRCRLWAYQYMYSFLRCIVRGLITPRQLIW